MIGAAGGLYEETLGGLLSVDVKCFQLMNLLSDLREPTHKVSKV